MNLPKIVFAGTPDFSVPCLQALIDSPVEIVGVYSQPDRAAGRGKKVQQSAVKQCALEAGLTVFQPESFKKKVAREQLAELQPDLLVVVAYGLILPQSVLDIPKINCINVHASLLPRWRGAAPIQRAIEAGDTQSGVCLMQMERGLDTGPVLASATVEITRTQTGGGLHDVLSLSGAELLKDKLADILAGTLEPQIQAEQGVSYAHKLNKAEMQIDWALSAVEIVNKIRAFNPWPVMSTSLGKKVIRVHAAALIDVATESVKV
ncbi:MAG: methionyl-tRNA formyltransferase, partial [Arenicellales bacterium]